MNFRTADVAEYYGIDVFGDEVMRDRLAPATYEALKKNIEEGSELELSVANEVASAMKIWAMEKGATHYSHWFQPLTGVTAEKHDAFINPVENGKVIMEFSGKELIKGEPDASSFPSGGLRNVFEARGYTAWDTTSPAFVKEDAAGVTLCIPTAFCSYTGEALDKKTPLLRSMEAINEQAVRLLRILGKDVKSVSCSVGPEQEYFLIDRKDYLRREDIIFSGRTLFGAKPPKGQEMDDHYFGALKERVASYMKELNIELWKLGISAKTQHNEAAPAQHELAVVYDSANIATDHNQLVMETMKRIAKRHGLECLLHEKPFAGVNGSGKHNNWSIVTDKGENLLVPGKEPHENLQFLLVLAAVLKSVDENEELLRYSASDPGNDLRLGAAEAPPAIISVFLGEQLEDIVAQYVNTGSAKLTKSGERLNMGVHSMPSLNKDANDRNRTSPFAFTGNKFEFRSVASNLSVAGPNTVLNTIVADSFSKFADELEGSTGDELQAKIKALLVRTFTEHQRILFGGNGYSKEWLAEASRRGLPNLASIVDATSALTMDKTVDLFERMHVLSRTELEARAEISYEIYAKTINIEAKTMIDMASKLFVPATVTYVTKLADSINKVKTAFAGMSVLEDECVATQKNLLIQASNLLNQTYTALEKLREEDKLAKTHQGKERAFYFRQHVVPAMEALRNPIDELEKIVDKDIWPVPTYSDLLYDV